MAESWNEKHVHIKGQMKNAKLAEIAVSSAFQLYSYCISEGGNCDKEVALFILYMPREYICMNLIKLM